MYKKGQSGNLKGRPIASLSLVDILRRKLGEIPRGCDNTYAEQLVDSYLKEALEKPELKRDAFDRIDGKPKQDLGIGGPDGGPVEQSITITFK
jgi:hypothetical protein